jgi:hypothetical protein
MRRHESHGQSADHAQHHFRDVLSAAGDASADLLATMFSDTHHEAWEDSVRRYEQTHPAGDSPSGRS